MENASRALVISGGILISIIIISLLMLVFNNLTAHQEANTRMERAQAVANFNKQYIPYDRDGKNGNDVRGTELLTLANKIIDYNKRKTTVGTALEDGGSSIGYRPLTLIVKIGSDSKNLITGHNSVHEIFTDPEYKASNKDNELETVFKKVDDIIQWYPSEDVLNKLANGYTNIFMDDFDNPELFKKAVKSFNMCFGKTKLIYEDGKINDDAKAVLSGGDLELTDSKGNTSHRNVKHDASMYYEYMQFKRARFKCTEFVTDEDEDGRVTRIKLEFLDKIS